MTKSKKYFNLFTEAIKENIWPTRCVICDTQGKLICDACYKKIQFIDINRSCKICGEPYGETQCCSCCLKQINKVKYKDLTKIWFDKCISAATLDENTGLIITRYKDSGEIRLSMTIAYILSLYTPKIWKSSKNTLITYIPDTQTAYTKRGFDHMELIAKHYSKILNIPYVSIFKRPISIDQRKLSRQNRNFNMQSKFDIKNEHFNLLKNTKSIILIDDVYTTGSTLNAAAAQIKKFNIEKINCITFLRTL